MKERIEGLSDRAELFLVITLSFAYFIGTSLSVLVLNIRQFELTTGRALRGIATLLRFLYHLYQGPVAALSVLPLGLLFGTVFWKWRNLWPLVVAHTLANLLALLCVT